MTPSPAIAPSIPATTPSRIHRFGPFGLIAVGIAMLLGLSVWLVSPHSLGPTVQWGLESNSGGLGGPVVTEQGATTVFVKLPWWPGCPQWSDGNSSWLTPVITYTPVAVIITLRESELYLKSKQAACGTYDYWGAPVPIHLDEPLGGRTLYDGSVSPPAAQPVR